MNPSGFYVDPLFPLTVILIQIGASPFFNNLVFFIQKRIEK